MKSTVQLENIVFKYYYSRKCGIINKDWCRRLAHTNKKIYFGPRYNDKYGFDDPHYLINASEVYNYIKDQDEIDNDPRSKEYGSYNWFPFNKMKKQIVIDGIII
jgi:hypothetical protein